MTTDSARESSWEPSGQPPQVEGDDDHPFDVIVAFASRLRAASARGVETGTLADCEEVIRARLDLAYCLVGTGWRPSQQIADGLRHDETLLAESNGAAENREAPPGSLRAVPSQHPAGSYAGRLRSLRNDCFTPSAKS
ncbi:MAG: hypothetical protein QOJ79_299 [Actinomycetota bacterium]|jgi:hypothetical protein|nr:hypothetical protein [Actinomycetota bacterium]